ncbi:MAG: DUF4124 domain-containing protein [Pedobacter sp.]|nr:DUF4124 domain-containing protein [Pedobacter sp.]
MKMTSTLAALLATFLLTGTVEAAQFYKWTDEQGVTHYTESPPPASAGKASEVKVRTKLPSGAREAAENSKKAATPEAGKGKAADKKDDKAAAPAKNTAENKETPEQYAEKCKTLKANLDAMQSHGRVRETDAEGNVRALSDEEKQKRMDETQREIKAYCEG